MSELDTLPFLNALFLDAVSESAKRRSTFQRKKIARDNGPEVDFIARKNFRLGFDSRIELVVWADQGLGITVQSPDGALDLIRVTVSLRPVYRAIRSAPPESDR